MLAAEQLHTTSALDLKKTVAPIFEQISDPSYVIWSLMCSARPTMTLIEQTHLNRDINKIKNMFEDVCAVWFTSDFGTE